MDLLTFRPETDFRLLLAVPLIPLTAYVLQIFLGRFLPRRGDWLPTGGMLVVMALTVWLAAKAIAAAYGGEAFAHHSSEAGLGWSFLYQELRAPDDPNNVTVGILYDGLGAAMLAVVGIVSFFVHLFSMGYMHGDRRYHVFFANISLFTFAMLGLVLSDNLLFLFVFWELMGLMSYLLIGHFGHDPASPRIRQASAACKKAFLTTRVGDVCLFVGMMMFFAHYETFSFTELWRLTQEEVAANGGDFPGWMTTAGLFMFGGTVGKSAQFPLHIWLPDAMEGPTPVSAMIHAATMVAAGVFLLGRIYPLLSPDVLAVVAAVGAFTALFAATIGTTVYDIKGVLAYSTISQLGFMVAAIGASAWIGSIGVVAGLFHMVTHAFFKACLFLSAGSVIHGCHHEQDMRRMGGLWRKMPLTFAAMLVCTLAIAGVPFFSGFYSKDMIIQATVLATTEHFSGAAAFALFALPVAAALTAFYMFRLIFMTFSGRYRGHDEAHAAPHGPDPRGHHPHVATELHGVAAHHEEAPQHVHADPHAHAEAHGHGHHEPHESPAPMVISLLALAAFGMLAGVFWPAALFGGDGAWFTKLVTFPSLYQGTVDVAALEAHLEHSLHSAHTLAVGISLTVATLGIALAWLMYGVRKVDPGRVTTSLGEVYHAVANKYYVDELVNATVIRGTMVLARVQRWIDEKVVDGLVNGTGRASRGLGDASAWTDLRIVDGFVNWVGSVTQVFGSVTRLFQTGRIQQYATFAVGGGLALAAWLILS